MKSPELASAYRVQRQLVAGVEIGAVKAGATNDSSAHALQYDGVLIGCIEKSRIFFNTVPKDFDLAEVEIVCAVRVAADGSREYEVLAEYIGIECPQVSTQEPVKDAVSCIESNNSAGDLLLFGPRLPDVWSHIDVYRNGVWLARAHLAALKFRVEDIVKEAVSSVYCHELFSGNEFYVATGGLSDIFTLKAGDGITFEYDNASKV